MKDKEKTMMKEVHRIVLRDAESSHENVAEYESVSNLAGVDLLGGWMMPRLRC